MAEFRIQERSFGASTVFRVIPETNVPLLVNQLTRRDRWVLLLLDGKRTLADLARLTRRSELDVAHTLALLLQWGYIEQVSRAENDTRSHRNPLLGGDTLTQDRGTPNFLA